MVFINVAARYPFGTSSPHGSDTFFVLDMARALERDGHASWILTPYSYIGLYPLSYPEGVPFQFAEARLLTGAEWDFLPWAFSVFYAVLLVHAGFLLFRAFRMSDEFAAVFAGLMALSPFFLYFTFGQASTRGYIVPIFVLGLFFFFWPAGGTWRRLLLFLMMSGGALTIHRSSLAIVVFEGLAGLVLLASPYLAPRSSRIRLVSYSAAILFGSVLVLTPFITPVRRIFESVPDLIIAYRLAEWEFSTGYFLKGDSPLILLVNLATNYIGSLGLILLVFPLAAVAFYPSSRDSRKRDMFVIVVLLVFAPFVWRAQYVQLIMLPFIYLVAGLSLQRLTKVMRNVAAFRALIRLRRLRFSFRPRLRRAAIASFIVFCVLFSLMWHYHRSNMTDASTGQPNWPTEANVNTGLYMRSLDGSGSGAFVSNSGLLDRRLDWYSDWNSAAGDPVSLLADGYLNATADDFRPKPGIRGDYLGLLSALYKIDRVFELNSSMPDYNLYTLSWVDSFGFLRLYLRDPGSAAFLPRVSTSEANITLVVELLSLGDQIRNPYTLEGSMRSRFLEEVSSSTYMMYEDGETCAFLAAMPTWSQS